MFENLEAGEKFTVSHPLYGAFASGKLEIKRVKSPNVTRPKEVWNQSLSNGCANDFVKSVHTVIKYFNVALRDIVNLRLVYRGWCRLDTLEKVAVLWHHDNEYYLTNPRHSEPLDCDKEIFYSRIDTSPRSLFGGPPFLKDHFEEIFFKSTRIHGGVNLGMLFEVEAV